MSYRPSLQLAAALCSLSCVASTPTSTPPTPDAVGQWDLVFYRPSSDRQDSALADSAVGTLGLRHLQPTDSTILPLMRHFPPGTLVGHSTLDLTPILGRQASCYFEARHDLPSVNEYGDTIRIWLGPSVPVARPGPGDSLWLAFTPGAADCGLYASVALNGSTGFGTWTEPSFAGELSGRFRMKRR